jgi:hypothetical protein
MPRNLVRLLALLAAAVLVLGACGDDDGGDAAPTTTAAPGAVGDDSDDTTDGATTTTAASPTPTGGQGRSDLPNLGSINDFCDLFVIFDDFDDEVFFGDDPDLTPDESSAAMAEGFQFMQALFVRAVQLSPNEIRGDMALFADAMAEYNALLAEYDYDFMALAMASMEDPELEERFATLDSPEFDAASERIEDYVLDECGVDLG